MKNSLALLLVLNLLNLPDGALSFTARPLQTAAARAIVQPSPTIVATPRHPTQLYGLVKDEKTEAISPEMTEGALDTTTEGDASTEVIEEEELSETKKLLQKVKQAGTAGAISYALWELGFWGISIPICVVGYYQVAGHWPDFSNQEDLQKVGAEAFAFVNFARLAVPLRIGLALSTTPWIDENVVQKFMKKDGEGGSEE